jgi:hypothetical protein
MASLTTEDLRRLRRRGDDEADPLVNRLAAEYGIDAVAGLLDVLLRWDPQQVLPTSAEVPREARLEAERFLHQPYLLDGAIAEGIDWTRIDRAQSLFQQFQMSGLRVRGCASLPACYALPGVASVLMGSGRLSAQVTRRLQDTISFLTTVMTPEALNPKDAEGASGRGTMWVRKVRLMHALMRCLTLQDATAFSTRPDDRASNALLKLDWSRIGRSEATPISQVELAFVLLTFSWLVVRGFHLLGVPMTDDEKDDHIYTWAVIGHALGIDDVLRPRTASDAYELFALIRDEYEVGTEDGRLLVAALTVFIVNRQRQAIQAFLPRERGPLLTGFINLFKPFGDACLESLARTLVRQLSGKQTANRLWVSRAPFIHWVVGKILRSGMTLIQMNQAKDWVPFALSGRRREKGLPGMIGRRLQAR